MTFKDHSSTQASGYAKARPTYPQALFAELARLAPGRALSWDAGAGSGQAAVSLADRRPPGRRGNMIMLIHASGWVTLHGHNSVNFVTAGESVTRGGVLARWAAPDAARARTCTSS